MEEKIWEIIKHCETCGDTNPIVPRVPWGKLECAKCREKAGDCLKCGANRNDCCC